MAKPAMPTGSEVFRGGHYTSPRDCERWAVSRIEETGACYAVMVSPLPTSLKTGSQQAWLMNPCAFSHWHLPGRNGVYQYHWPLACHSHELVILSCQNLAFVMVKA